MSSNFSANAGSLLILKVSTRRGFNPWARQMRRTLASLIPTAAAIVRVLQCVALAGCWRVVMVTTRLVRRAPMVGFGPGRCASFYNAATPSARKRLRQRETFFGVIAMLAAISLSGWPEAASNTMGARSATRTGRDRLRAWDSNRVLSSALNVMAGAIRIRKRLLHHKPLAGG